MQYMKEFSSPKTTEYTDNTENVQLEEYIARAAAGDTEGIAELYIHTQSSVYGFALSILKNTADAEDVMHDTYVRIFSYAGSYKPRGNPIPWILEITKNLAFMALRKKKRSQPIQDELLHNSVSNADFSEQVTDELSVTQAMMTLGQEERQIVTLHAVTGLKHREIAKLLDMPLATVLSKYNRSIKKMKKILGG